MFYEKMYENYDFFLKKNNLSPLEKLRTVIFNNEFK